MPKKRYDRIFEQLCELARLNMNNGDTRLPGVRELGRLFHCSPVTVMRAVKVLCSQGCLTVAPKRGIHIVSVPPARLELPDRTPAAATPGERLKSALFNDLLLGTIVDENAKILPVKQLAIRYGTGSRMVRQVLADLLQQNALQYNGRFFSVTPDTRQPILTIHLIAVGDRYGEIGDYLPHRIPLLQFAQEECRRRGIHLQIHILSRGSGSPAIPHAVANRLRLASTDPATAGFILLNIHFTPNLMQQLITLAGYSGKPCALLDDGNTVTPEDASMLPAHWQVFSMAGSAFSGLLAARELMARGHRTAACFNPFPYDWAVQRCRGVAEAYRQAGQSWELTIFEDTHPFPAVDNAVYGDKLSHSLLAQLDGLEAFLSDQQSRQTIIESFEVLINTQIHRKHLRDRMLPFMYAAIADRRITTWIAVNDSVASECLDYLSRHGKGVQERISLIGFDDSRLAMRRHISSYNFNTAQVASAMINTLLQPVIAKRTVGNGRIKEIAGYMMFRGS